VVKPSALGDIAHALPVATSLRGRFPDARISWVANTGFAPLLAGHPHLDEVIPFDRGAFRSAAGGVRYGLRFANLLRRKRFDLVLDLQGLARTGLMCAASGAAVRVGFADAREGSRHAYTHRVDTPPGMHAVDRYWLAARAVGAGQGEPRFVLPVDPGEAAAVRELFAPLPRPVVAVAVGAKWVTKRWPPAHFADLLSRLGRGSVVLVGAADDIPLSAEVANAVRRPTLDLTGRTPLPRLVAVLAAVDVMVANDTGPLHVAAALGTPCVAPYLCTAVRRHGPYTSPAGGVETTVACGGSYLKRCPHAFRCFADLTPDRLLPALLAAVDRCRNPSS
jgi:lipopolysaccharide heptosyltransferase I